MRGKCESCEFYVVSAETAEHEGETYIGDGSCHIRSVEGIWPWRRQDDQCGEHRQREGDEDEREEAEVPVMGIQEFECSCGRDGRAIVRGTKVLSWNGHDKCSGRPLYLFG